MNLQSNITQEKLPWDFFLLVFILSIPLYLVGGRPLPIPVDLPVSALAFVNPLIAAVILTLKRSGIGGVKELIKKVFDFERINYKIWYLPILLLNPLIMVLSYTVMRLTGMPLPSPVIPWIMVPVFFIVFFVAAVFEELGWMGYAIDPMQKRWGALKAALILGVVWAIIHIIPDIQNNRGASWILWHRLASIANRVLIVWIYNNTRKSVFGSILYHDMNNVTWALFPNYGSHYNPFVTGILTILAAVMVVIGWGPKTLARYGRRTRQAGSTS